MKKISIKAVLIGGVVDVFSPAILALPLTLYVMSRLDVTHIPQDRLSAAVTAAMHGNPLIYGIQLALGMAGSALGGYVAGLIARHDHMLNGALSSWLCLAIGVYTLSAGKNSHSLTMEILMLASSPVLALCGGYIASRRSARAFPAEAMA